MSGARIRVGFEHFRSSRQYQILVPDARIILNQPTIHTAEHQACAFFYLGLPRQEIPRARIFVRDKHKAWWEQRRAGLGLAPGDEYVMIHPTALYATKQWAAEKFAQLAAALEQEMGLKPVFSCGPGEGAVLDAVQNASSSPIRRLEDMRLGQFAAAFSGARLFVGNDSGPAHMAAALSRPLVVIFGSSSSTIWGPWPRQPSNPPAQVVQNFYECNPCPGDRCYRFERPECILSVSLGRSSQPWNPCWPGQRVIRKQGWYPAWPMSFVNGSAAYPCRCHPERSEGSAVPVQDQLMQIFASLRMTDFREGEATACVWSAP